MKTTLLIVIAAVFFQAGFALAGGGEDKGNIGSGTIEGAVDGQ